jgi:carboxymethylenebutenolidase
MERDPDIGAVFDEHVAAEFVHLDLDATMATMTEDPYVNHVPVMTGGVGLEEVRRFYGQHFIGKWPADIAITPVSRTVGHEQVVDELVLSFTHDIEMDQLLPGVAPTGRPVRLAFCVVAKFDTSTSTGTRRRSSCRSVCWTRPDSRSPAPSRPRTCSIRARGR